MEVMTRWGSRPSEAEQMMTKWRNESDPKAPKEEVKQAIQLWYAMDRQQSIEREFIAMIQQLPLSTAAE